MSATEEEPPIGAAVLEEVIGIEEIFPEHEKIFAEIDLLAFPVRTTILQKTHHSLWL